MTFFASDDVFAYLQRTGSRATTARRLDTRLSQPALNTFLVPPGQPQLHQYPIEIANGLAVAYWRFEEASGATAADAIGSLDGAYGGGITYRVDGALAVNQENDVNYAVRFNGSTAEVAIPHHADINFTTGQDGSVEFWIKTTQGTLAHVLGKHDAAGYPYAFVLQSDGKLRFERYNGSVTTQVVSANAIDDGGWHYVVGQFDAGVQMLLQIDDEAAVTTADPGGSTGNTSNLVVGNRGGSDDFAGDLDELAVYRYAMTGALRQRHYDVGMGVAV